MIRDSVSRVGRLTVALLCQTLILGLLAFLECQVLIAHYQTTENALQLLGFESRSLGEDRLLGPYLGAVFGDASASQMLAWVIVLVTAIGSCYALAKVYALVELINERIVIGREQTAEAFGGDPALLQALSRALGGVTTQIWLSGVELAVVGSLVAATVWWDMQLNFFRAIAESYGLEETTEAVQTVLLPALEFERNGSFFALKVIATGVWGFSAAMVLAALMLKLCVRNIAERWNQWCDASGELMSRAWSAATSEDHVTADPRPAVAQPSTVPGEAPHFTTFVDSGPVAAVDAARNSAEIPGGEEVEVIGGELGERVSRERARRDPRYFVDRTNGEVWNAEHRRELFGETELPKAA